MQLLATYQRFLPSHGIRALLGRWRHARSRWAPLATALTRYQVTDAPVDMPEVQRLAQQWMNLAMAVFGGQLGTVLQWAQMHRLAPNTAAHAGLDPALLAYLEQAIAARMTALGRHLDAEDLARLDGSLGPEWERFASEGQALLAAGTLPPPPPKRVRCVPATWNCSPGQFATMRCWPRRCARPTAPSPSWPTVISFPLNFALTSLK